MKGLNTQNTFAIYKVSPFFHLSNSEVAWQSNINTIQKKELPWVGFQPTTLCSLGRTPMIIHLSH